MMVLEKAYQDFKERQSKREKVLAYGVVLFLVYFVSWAFISLSGLWFSDYWLWAGLIVFAFGFFYIVSRPWVTESAKTRVFANLYEAVKFLEKSTGSERSKLVFIEEASEDVRSAIVCLSKFRSGTRRNTTIVFQNEDSDPLYHLAGNLYTRVYPRVILQRNLEEMTQVLRDSARIFSDSDDVNMNEVATLNERLEHYDPVKLDEIIVNKLFRPLPDWNKYRGMVAPI
jgi:hypothetical protein